MRDWIDLTPYWDEIKELARLRLEAKQGSPGWGVTIDGMNKHANAHFVGLLGEKVFELKTGMVMNADARYKGEPSPDFGRYEIKTSTCYWDPILKEDPKQMKKAGAVYVLVTLDMERKRGALVGQITVEKLFKNRRLEDFGYGAQFVAHEDELAIINVIEASSL